MQEKNLRQTLTIIVSTIFVLPFLVLAYIFYEQQITLSPSNIALFFLIMILEIMGIILVRYVFSAVSNTADFLKKTAEGSEKLSLNLHQEAVELNEISSSVNRMLERFEKTTNSLTQTKEALQASEEKYNSILEYIEEGYYEVDLAGNFIFVNTSVSKMLGYSIEELKGMNNRQYMDRENSKKVFPEYNEVFQTGIPKKNLDVELVRKDAARVYVGLSISLIRDSSKQAIGFRGIIRDITERKRMEEEIKDLSVTDYLTGLHNRRGFMTLAERELKIQERTKGGLLLLFSDVDNMKWINDTLGHEKGDRALIEISAIFKKVFRKSDIVARIGGDEFAVLGIGASSNDFDIFRSQLKHHLDMFNAIENREYKLSVSVGMAYKDPENTCSLDELISKADELMYEQKRSKRCK
jgi:diguanylate cyclase (GGDEF)-like protein/PAS domain S-box-containing protein